MKEVIQHPAFFSPLDACPLFVLFTFSKKYGSNVYTPCMTKH